MEVKIQIIEKLFSYESVTYSYLILPVLALIFWKKLQRTDLVVFTVYGIVCFTLLSLFKLVPKSERQYFYALYTAFEYSIFAYFFWKNISPKKIKHSILYISVAFYLFQIIYLLLVKQIRFLDSVPIGVETIIILLFIIYFFYDFSKKLLNNYIYNHYCFWLSVGILIYLGGSFFFYILISHLSKEEIDTFGNFTYGAEIIKNLLFAVSIIVYVKNPLKNNDTKSISVPYLDMI